MTKKPNSPLSNKIEKIIAPDHASEQWRDHLDESIRKVQEIAPLPEFNLRDPESARQAQEMFSQRFDELQQLAKEVSATKKLLEQEKFVPHKKLRKATDTH